MSPKDLLIVALLLVNAGLIWFRPNPPVKVDTSDLQRGQAELSAQVDGVRNRIEKLEGHLSEMELLDQQLKVAAGMEDIDDPITEPQPAATEKPSQRNPRAKTDPAELTGGAGRVRLYKVASGDTLSVLAQQFYPDGPAGTMTSLARFNRLPAPDFPIFPGDTLKVPSAETLR